MTDKVQTLQDIINARARKKLEKDLNDLHSFFNSNTITATTWDNGSQCRAPEIWVKNPDGQFKAYSLRGLYNVSSEFRKDVEAFFLPQYIENETASFVREVEKIREDVDYLLDNTASL